VLLILALMCLGGAVYLVSQVVTLPGRERELSVQRAARYGKLGLPVRPQSPHFKQRVVGPLRDRLAGAVLKVNPRTSIEAIQIKILSAGMGRRLTAQGFLALKGAGDRKSVV